MTDHRIIASVTTITIALIDAPDVTTRAEAGTLHPATFTPRNLHAVVRNEPEGPTLGRLTLTGRERRKGSLYEVSAVYADTPPATPGVHPIDAAPRWAAELAAHSTARPESEVKAEALREAAAAWQAGGWADDLPPAGSARPALILGMTQRAIEFLRDRADTLDTP